MNVKALIPLVAGLGIGGLALTLGIKTLKNARAGQRPVTKVGIWGAKQNIPRGRAIRAEMLTELTYPKDLIPEGAFESKDNLVGRVPNLAAPRGLPVLEGMLTPPGTRPGIFVKPGYRAVAVKIDAGSGVDYHLEPGRFVDVVASFKVRRDGRNETIAKTIVENAELGAVGERLSPAASDEEGQSRGRPVRAVTLFVKPEQVKTLLLAEQRGRIKLSLRGDEDDSEVRDSVWLSDNQLMGLAAAGDEEQPGQPAVKPGAALEWFRGLFTGQAKLAARGSPMPRSWILKIYRGDKREVLEFKNADSHELVEPAKAATAGRQVSSGPTGPGVSVPPRTPASGGDDDQGAGFEPAELMG